MKTGRGSVVRIGILVLAGLAAGCATVPLQTPQARRDWAEAAIWHWSNVSNLLAKNLMAEYGPPVRIESSRLLWNEKGPWRRLSVWDVVPYYDVSVGPDNLEETLAYPVPSEKHKALAAFSDKLLVSKDGTELSARATSEAIAFLTLNLADEIIQGRRDPEGARSFYEVTVQLSLAGKSSAYMQGLLFHAGPSGPGQR